MPEWIQVDLDTYKKERKATIRGIEVELLVSPYDIPEAVRGYYCEERDRFVLEFKYLVKEPTKAHVYDRHITYQVGESSDRLFAVEIDVAALKAEAVGVRVGIRKEIDEALERLVIKPISSLREDNYRLAKDAVVAKQSELFEALAV